MRTFILFIMGLSILFHITTINSNVQAAVPVSPFGEAEDFTPKAWGNFSQQFEENQFRIVPPNNEKESYRAENPKQGFQAEFSRQKVDITPSGSTQSLSMQLKGIGHGKHITLPALKNIQRSEEKNNRLHYERENGVTEWYVNRSDGIEQGFTLQQPLAHRQAGPLEIHLAFNKGWRAELNSNGLDLYRGETHLSYGKLKVWDSQGTVLDASMQLTAAQTVALVVNEREAVYPLFVDPVIQAEQIIPINFIGAPITFGSSVTIDGETVAIGDPDWLMNTTVGNEVSGIVRTIEPDGSSEYLFGRDAGDLEKAGYSVAIDGDYLVIGAPYNDLDMSVDAGKVYLYHRDDAGPNTSPSWSFVGELTPTSGMLSAHDLFGWSVAISGSIIAVGAPGTQVDMDDNAGAIYVFVRNVVGYWQEVGKLTASSWDTGDQLGRSVAVSGTTIVAGAPFHDVLGSSAGAAYVFGCNSIINFPNITWECSETKELLHVNATGGEYFGKAVDIDSNTIVVGAYGDDAGGVINAGSAFIFERDSGGSDAWGLAKMITASDGEIDDKFGSAIAIDGDTVVVGAVTDKDMGHDSGSAYVFQRDNNGLGQWGQLQKILAEDGTDLDFFGSAVDISGNRIIVGSPYHGDGGVAYLFENVPEKGGLFFPVKDANGKVLIIRM